MRKILGVMDEDPFNYLTWSGSSKFFFEALQKHDSLSGAISAEPSKIVQNFAKLQSIQLGMDKWKFAYHLNTSLYSSMTQTAINKIKNLDNDFDAIIQVGAWYNLISPDVINVSYHDGNLATLLSSPFGHPKISQHKINKALEYERRLYQQLDLIFPMSEWLGQSFINDFGVSPEKVIAVGAGINLSKIIDTKGRFYDKKRLLMVGKDFTRKGGNDLLLAFKEVRKVIPDAELRIIGPILDDVPDGVICLGFLSKNNPADLDKLLQEYATASVFVVPSLYEPFGISFAEAMAHRVPCVGTNICAMPEIIQDGVTGFIVPPADSKQLGNRLIELLSSEELCREMGNAGYERYLENYTWDIVTSKIINSIENL